MSDDLTGLRLIDPDDGSWPPVPPPPVQPGHVDVTSRLSDGSVWRVATTADEVRLTVAGPDGMATLVLAPGDCDTLAHALHMAEMDVQRMRRGGEW